MTHSVWETEENQDVKLISKTPACSVWQKVTAFTDTEHSRGGAGDRGWTEMRPIQSCQAPLGHPNEDIVSNFVKDCWSRR